MVGSTTELEVEHYPYGRKRNDGVFSRKAKLEAKGYIPLVLLNSRARSPSLDMPQTYGVAAESSQVDEPSVDADSSSPLLGARHSNGQYKTPEDGVAGIPSSVSNLANTIIGSGMLTFPLVSFHESSRRVYR